MNLKQREGQKVPEVSFQTREDGAWKTVTTNDIFSAKKVVVFSLPGAFTPTCSASHVPRYDELASVFFSLGVDAIACVSVNDAFVMNAWREAQDVENVYFIPDGNGEFTEKMGMLVEKDNLGFGRRSWRYSMLVDDGTIKKMFIEPNKPGDPFEVSDADTMLGYLVGDKKTLVPPDIVLFTKANCGHCKRAKAALSEKKLPFEEILASPRILKALSDNQTTPQVFINGKLVGGADEVIQWLADK
ncbi:MAG: glutathione peroxidase [Myxococcales bacterium]|nr:glutathione peroxidase [Myxococcales bacterium]